MRLSIIDKYISKEILLAWLSVFFVLLSVVLSADSVHLLAWLAEGRIPGDTVIPLLINSSYEFTVLLVPLSLYLGVLLAFGRLYKDSEMTAVSFAGLGPVQWYRPLLLIAVPVTFAMLVLSLLIMPQVVEQRDAIMASINSRNELNTLFAGRFNESRKGKAVFFLESQSNDGAEMDKVFHHQQRSNSSYLDIADKARKYRSDSQRDYMLMENGVRYVGEPGRANFTITEYGKYGIYVPDERHRSEGQSLKALPSIELMQSDDLQYQAEFQWRLAVPVATLVLAMIALPLSKTSPRSGKYANLALAVFLYLVYSNMLSMGKAWIVKDAIPAWIGMWWVHLVALTFLAIKLNRVKAG